MALWYTECPFGRPYMKFLKALITALHCEVHRSWSLLGQPVRCQGPGWQELDTAWKPLGLGKQRAGHSFLTLSQGMDL